MKNILAILSVDLREAFDNRKNKSKNISFLAFLIVFGLLFCALSAFYAFSMSILCREMNINYIYTMSMMGGMGSVLLLTTSVVRAKGIFCASDYDNLRSMPIKKKEIVTAKIIGLYIVEFAYSAVSVIPSGLVISFVSGNFIYFPLSLLVTILLPGIPTALGALFGVFVAIFAERSRFANIISTIAYIAFFIVIFIMSAMMNNTSSGNAEEFVSVFSRFEYINPSLIFISKAFTSNMLWLIAFIGCNVFAVAITVIIVAALFDKVVELSRSKRNKIKYERKTLKIKGQFSALLKIEAKRFFSSKIYFINTVLSGVFSVLIVVMFYYTGNNKDFNLYDLTAFSGVLICLMLGICVPSASGISIEGKNFYLIKTLPIKYTTYANVKITWSTIVVGTFALIASVLYCFISSATLTGKICVVIMTLFYAFGESSLGLLINFSHYKLKWKNENEVVKQSASVFIHMIIDFVFSFILIALGLSLMQIDGVLPAVVPCAVVVLFSIIIYIITIKNADKKMRMIEDF